jgi:hypothetical protein
MAAAERRAAELFALLHNGAAPEGAREWDAETRRFYLQVAVMFDAGRLPPRVVEAEQRAHFRELLSRSSLGDPEAQAAIARSRRQSTTLPDRWMRKADLPALLGLYRDRRETWGEDHDTAVTHVLGEVDYEPDQDDLFEGGER